MSEGRDIGRQVALGLDAAKQEVVRTQAEFGEAWKRMEEEANRAMPRYIHERPPKLRWWRRILGRWGR